MPINVMNIWAKFHCPVPVAHWHARGALKISGVTKLVSPGAATDDVTLFFVKKLTTVLVIVLTPTFSARSFLQYHL